MVRMLFLSIWISCLSFCANKPPDPLQLQSFQLVWETVRDQHWDLASTGLDWNQIHAKYQPQAAKAQDANQLRPILKAMLGELGQSHFGIWGGEQLGELEALRQRLPSGSGSPGFEVNWVDGRVFVTRVEPDSAAAKAGVALGSEILALRGVPADEITGVLKRAYPNGHSELDINRRLGEFISGPIGESFQLELHTPAGKTSLSLPWETPRGQFIQLIDMQVYYRYESLMLPEKVCLVRFNVFAPQTKMDFERLTMPQLADAKALIFDLRGNPGGLGIISVALANRLVERESTKLGVMSKKADSFNFAIFPQKPVFRGPIAVLIDACSASTSEIFAAGLQDLERARIFGSRSAGAALPSMITDLPNGDRFQYAIADYVSTKGRHIEGKGVEPDQATPHSPSTLAKGEDHSMMAALAWIQSAKL